MSTFTDAQIAAVVAAAIAEATPGITAAVKAALSADTSAKQEAPKQADAPAPKADGKLLTRTSLRAFKATKRGAAYAKANPGASVSGIREGRFPMPEGFVLPTGEAKEAIAKAKAEKEAQA